MTKCKSNKYIHITYITYTHTQYYIINKLIKKIQIEHYRQKEFR